MNNKKIKDLLDGENVKESYKALLGEKDSEVSKNDAWFGYDKLELLIKCNQDIRKELEVPELDDCKFDRNKKFLYDLNDYLVDKSESNYKYDTEVKKEIDKPIEVYNYNIYNYFIKIGHNKKN